MIVSISIVFRLVFLLVYFLPVAEEATLDTDTTELVGDGTSESWLALRVGETDPGLIVSTSIVLRLVVLLVLMPVTDEATDTTEFVGECSSIS